MSNFALRINEANQAAAMYRSGLSLRQIAFKFSVSQTAVKNVLSELGVQFRDKHTARRLRYQHREPSL